MLCTHILKMHSCPFQCIPAVNNKAFFFSLSLCVFVPGYMCACICFSAPLPETFGIDEERKSQLTYRVSPTKKCNFSVVNSAVVMCYCQHSAAVVAVLCNLFKSGNSIHLCLNTSFTCSLPHFSLTIKHTFLPF